MTLSLHLERANVVSSVGYLGMIFGLGFGYFLFGEEYELLSLVGIVMVIAGVLLNVLTPRTPPLPPTGPTPSSS
jgi:drug/metabolite transporter (DMT)-like permease